MVILVGGESWDEDLGGFHRDGQRRDANASFFYVGGSRFVDTCRGSAVMELVRGFFSLLV